MGPLFCALCFVLCVSVCSVAGPVLCVRLLCVRLARRGVRALCAKCLFLLHSNNRSMSVFPRPHAVWDIGDLFEGQSNHLKGEHSGFFGWELPQLKIELFRCLVPNDAAAMGEFPLPFQIPKRNGTGLRTGAWRSERNGTVKTMALVRSRSVRNGIFPFGMLPYAPRPSVARSIF